MTTAIGAGVVKLPQTFSEVGWVVAFGLTAMYFVLEMNVRLIAHSVRLTSSLHATYLHRSTFFSIEAGKRMADCTQRAEEVKEDPELEINGNEAVVAVCFGKKYAKGTSLLMECAQSSVAENVCEKHCS